MEPRVEFLTGKAGTGKTYELKRRISESKKSGKRRYGILAATTGIAAVNLSGAEGDQVTTINSLLKYFDTDSLMDRSASGRLHKALAKCIIRGKNICIDEISMMNSLQLDLIYNALAKVNENETIQKRGGLGLVLSGDFCQLPPVEGKFAFEAECWKHFAQNITKLEKVWRQDNVEFLEAINQARNGEGEKAAGILDGLHSRLGGSIFAGEVDSHFDGTTIYPTNKQVDYFNQTRLAEMLSEGHAELVFTNYRWGVQSPDWKSIPNELHICEGAYVMILTNNPPDFSFVNGDCGYVLEGSVTSGWVTVNLNRGYAQTIKRITRRVWVKEHPDGRTQAPSVPNKGDWIKQQKAGMNTTLVDGPNWAEAFEAHLNLLTNEDRKSRGSCQPYFDYTEEKWVVGEVRYLPIRLAYASSCHKSQGLSLDKVQIDITHKFFGYPSMMYVALSRCRTPEGLRIVGGSRLLAERTNVFEEVLPWI